MVTLQSRSMAPVVDDYRNGINLLTINTPLVSIIAG
jgi:hypothetical protein